MPTNWFCFGFINFLMYGSMSENPKPQYMLDTSKFLNLKGKDVLDKNTENSPGNGKFSRRAQRADEKALKRPATGSSLDSISENSSHVDEKIELERKKFRLLEQHVTNQQNMYKLINSDTKKEEKIIVANCDNMKDMWNLVKDDDASKEKNDVKDRYLAAINAKSEFLARQQKGTI